MPLENIFPRATREGVRASPGVRGGANWPPPAYSPRTGLLYVLGSYVPMRFVVDTAINRGDGYSSGYFVDLPDAVTFGTLSAIDPATGKIRWQRRTHRHLMYGGAVVTDGDVLFYGDLKGFLYALDARTGETLWQDRAVKGDVGPPIAFRLEGHARVAITSRHGIVMYGLDEKR
jgi:alcohol dehydrogenase (cytochrome c)